MKTQIYLWIDPLYVGHEKSKGKLYFYLTIEEDLTELSPAEVEDSVLEGYISEILDFADVQQNWNYGVVSISQTDSEERLVSAPSPKELRAKAKAERTQALVTCFVENPENVHLSKNNIEAKDGGIIEVKVPNLQVVDSINFGSLWNSLEKNVLGKISKGDLAEINDEFGNPLFRLQGGNFLSLVGADIDVYGSDKITHDSSIFTKLAALKGGVYIRENGTLDIGDRERTFYLNINVGNLLKASLKLGKSLNELTSGDEIVKLLPEQNNTK
jgi:hypothetical protein